MTSSDPRCLKRLLVWLGVSLLAVSWWIGLSPGTIQADALHTRPGRQIAVKPQAPRVEKEVASALGKAGVATTGFGWNHPDLLKSIGASWAFDGYPDVTSRRGPIRWIPEVQNRSMLTPKVVSSLTAANQDGRAQYLLTFNEPDNVHQSDLTPSQVASLWPQLESTGLMLGSPATDWLGDGWLARFMQIAEHRHLRVNFIVLHFYQDFTSPGAVASLRSRLINIYDTYRKPLWITEVGAVDIRAWGEHMTRIPTEALAARYVRQLFAMLNTLPFVQLYSWYTDDCWTTPSCQTSSLFTPGGQLTPVGRAFQLATVPRAHTKGPGL
jgi:Glycosyl hydrolase catalytic core